MNEEDAFETLGDWSDPGAYSGALILLTDLEGRAALQFRDRGAAVHPGRGGLFGGGVGPGETLLQAAMRELEEETSLRPQADALHPYLRVLAEGSRGRLYVFRCQAAVAPCDIRLMEGGGFGLFEPRDWRRLSLAPFTRDLLERHQQAFGA